MSSASVGAVVCCLSKFDMGCSLFSEVVADDFKSLHHCGSLFNLKGSGTQLLHVSRNCQSVFGALCPCVPLCYAAWPTPPAICVVPGFVPLSPHRKAARPIPRVPASLGHCIGRMMTHTTARRACRWTGVLRRRYAPGRSPSPLPPQAPHRWSRKFPGTVAISSGRP